MSQFSLTSQFSWPDLTSLQSAFFSTIFSEHISLVSGDGFSVSLPGSFLLASSSLVRQMYLPNVRGQDIFLPSVRGDTLLLVVELLRRGTTGGIEGVELAGHRLKEVQGVMDLLHTKSNVSLKTYKENISVSEGNSLVCSDAWSLEKSFNASPFSTGIKPKSRAFSQETNSIVPVICPVTSTPKTAFIGSKKVENFDSNLPVKNEICEYFEIEPKVTIEEGIPYRNIENNSPLIRITCPFCADKFSNNQNLKRHIERSHEKIEKPCRVCGETFTSRSTMEKHVLLRHPETAHPCPVCDRSFILKKNLNRHMERVHEKFSLSCNQCAGLFNSKSSLKWHMKRNHEERVNNITEGGDTSTTQDKDNSHFLVKCLKCDKQFSTKDNMVRHHAIIHEGRRFACEECDYENLIRRRVLKHCVKSQHDPEKIMIVYRGENANY